MQQIQKSPNAGVDSVQRGATWPGGQGIQDRTMCREFSTWLSTENSGQGQVQKIQDRTKGKNWTESSAGNLGQGPVHGIQDRAKCREFMTGPSAGNSSAVNAGQCHQWQIYIHLNRGRCERRTRPFSLVTTR